MSMNTQPPGDENAVYQLFSVEHVQRLCDDLTKLRERDIAVTRVLEAAKRLLATAVEHVGINERVDSWQELQAAVSALRDREGR